MAKADEQIAEQDTVQIGYRAARGGQRHADGEDNEGDAIAAQARHARLRPVQYQEADALKDRDHKYHHQQGSYVKHGRSMSFQAAKKGIMRIFIVPV